MWCEGVEHTNQASFERGPPAWLFHDKCAPFRVDRSIEGCSGVLISEGASR
jgi:hypothetical protein